MRPSRPMPLAALCACLMAVIPAAARVDVTVDADSLNDLLRSMAPDHVDVALASGRSVTLQLQDLKVTGFDPSAGPNGGVVASLRLKVPELGIDIPVEPRLGLEMGQAPDGTKACNLKFQKVVLALPIAGNVDVAPLMPPLPVMPDSSWIVRSARGNVRVKPVLVDAKTGVKSIRFGFDLTVGPASP
ncbi:MAG TPA: hypothetical protein VMR65_11600 [Candidatus Sulfotelmatobacter sp.]|jgi:hypothetical protein|nr:hypothetical protein [Candidatus Sulfotelmatobacter sp.]